MATSYASSAKQRLLRTGSSKDWRSGRSLSPSPLHAHSVSTQQVLAHAYSEKTRARMWGAVERFNTWALDSRLKEGVVPSEKMLVDYVANTMAGHMACSTAKTHLRLLRTHWESKGWKWQGAQQLALCMKAVKRLVPPSSIRDRRTPVSTQMLELLQANLELGHNEGVPVNQLHTACFAAALCAFWGQLRLGEVLTTSSKVNDYNHLTHPVVNDLTLNSDQRSYKLLLPVTKTEVLRGDSVLIPHQAQDSLDPVITLYNHVGSVPLNSLPLFSYVDPSLNIWRCLTKDLFLSVCNSIWSQHGISKITGHSFRIGGTVHYLKMGVNPHLVKASGRWKSDAFYAYWRDMATISARHLEGLSTKGNAGRTSL